MRILYGLTSNPSPYRPSLPPPSGTLRFPQDMHIRANTIKSRQTNLLFCPVRASIEETFAAVSVLTCASRLRTAPFDWWRRDLWKCGLGGL
jgi:hypothetical protein